MIKVITDKNEIAKLQQKFQSKLDILCSEEIPCIIGFPGGSWPDTIGYSSKLNIWLLYFLEKKRKAWINLFGVGKPAKDSMTSITIQLNFPISNINRNVAGAFAIDKNNEILVLHRGRIGGGKKGVGKKLVFNNFNGEFVTAVDGDRETEFCLVGELNSPHFPQQILDFVSEIERIKLHKGIVKSKKFSELTEFSYTDEHFGKSVTENNEPRVITRTHGIVVNTLRRELKKKKYETANSRTRDLFIFNKRKISHLFEIKTSSATQCLYSAIGQLLLYSIPIENEVDLIAVLPDKLDKDVEGRFTALGIKCLYYKWKNGEPIFIELDRIL